MVCCWCVGLYCSACVIRFLVVVFALLICNVNIQFKLLSSDDIYI